ncbi:MAG: hypothetical protein QNJ54_14985, partial [Prochloraceae cyanobacterium]|nr:hypothetical protein [Prochloraceae cyanobacterium]
VNQGATGNGGNLTIDTNSLRLENGGLISASTFGEGNAGNLTVRAAQEIVLRGSALFANVNQGATGNGGNLTIDTNSLRLENGGLISASNFAEITSKKVNSGDLTINTHSLLLENEGVILTNNLGSGFVGDLTINAHNIEFNQPSTGIQASTDSEKDGSNITINTGSLRLIDGAQIQAITRSSGNVGDLNINAQNIELVGVDPIRGNSSSGIFIDAAVSRDGNVVSSGNGGNINIKTDNLRLIDGAQINASTSGTGNAGSLTINAQNIELVGTNQINKEVSNASSSLRTSTNGQGDGDSIRITTSSLQVIDGAEISAASKIDENRPQIGIDRSQLGKIGNIEITANTVNLIDGGKITVESQSPRQPLSNNQITINAGRINLDRGASITTEAKASQGANITINLDDRLVFRRNSSISATSGSTEVNGSGGDITIKSPFILTVPSNNEITANAFQGTGGNINITSNAILGYPQYLKITASSQRGLDGIVTFNNLVTNLNPGIVEAPITPIDATALVTQNVCAIAASGSSFVAKGKGGIPPSPTDLLDSQRPIVEWTSRPQGNLETRVTTRSRVTSEEEETAINANESDVDKNAHRYADPEGIVVVRARREDEPLVIQQARGWIKKTDGTIVLTAYPTETTSGHSSVLTPPNCSIPTSRNGE